MPYHHSNVYIVRVDDTDDQGEARTWFVGPYGSTRADQTANQLSRPPGRPRCWRDRQCTVEALYSDDECLRVADYSRTTEGHVLTPGHRQSQPCHHSP